MQYKIFSNSILIKLFPFIGWLKGYNISTFQRDALAGITVAVVLIPQSMAYAMLAGLPPIYGLYAGVAAPVIAALWGSLRQLSTGPIAIMSLLVFTTLEPLAKPGSKAFIELAFVLSFIVGVMYLVIGISRFGMVMNFISNSTIKGFTSAAALIITTTQLPHLLGLQVSRHGNVFSMFLEIIQSLASVQIPTFLIGLLAFGIIIGLKKYNKNLPAGLFALVITTGLVLNFDLHQKGVSILGRSPEGLPHLSLPFASLDTLFSLAGPAFVIAMVSFAETYSVGKAISAKTEQKINIDQEFIGQGLANLIGSFLQSYPVSGSFSRTAINFDMGAKTGIASAVASIILIMSLLFLTPLFVFIPRASLAALVISAVLVLFKPLEVFTLWKIDRHDGIVAAGVFVIALLTKPDYALLTGVILSLIFYLWKTMHPRIVCVSKDPERDSFINADEQHKPICPQILQLRSDNSIYFANAEYTFAHILSRLDLCKTSIKYLLFDFQGVGFIDMTGIDELMKLMAEVQRRGVKLVFTNVHLPVKKMFASSGFIRLLNPELLFDSRGEALSHLCKEVDHGYCQKECSYLIFRECSGRKKTVSCQELN